MKTPQWKVPPHLRDRGDEVPRLRAQVAELTAKMELVLLRLQSTTTLYTETLERIQRIRARNTELEQMAQRYRELRDLGVVLMDGECKHLQGTGMDAFFEAREVFNRPNFERSLALLLRERQTDGNP